MPIIHPTDPGDHMAKAPLCDIRRNARSGHQRSRSPVQPPARRPGGDAKGRGVAREGADGRGAEQRGIGAIKGEHIRAMPIDGWGDDGHRGLAQRHNMIDGGLVPRGRDGPHAIGYLGPSRIGGLVASGGGEEQEADVAAEWG